MSVRITADVEYVSGHLRTGHYELNLTHEEYIEYKALSEEEQDNWIKEGGNFIVDDYEVNDVGSIESVEIEED